MSRRKLRALTMAWWQRWLRRRVPADGTPGDEFDRFARRVDALHDGWYAEDVADKISNRMNLKMSELYRQADEHERRMFERLIEEWLASGDVMKRYSALSLVREFSIASALPAVRAALTDWRARLARIEANTRHEFYARTERSEALTACMALSDILDRFEQRTGANDSRQAP